MRKQNTFNYRNIRNLVGDARISSDFQSIYNLRVSLSKQ